MTTPDRAARAPRGQRLPADDPTLFELDLAGLAARWAEAMDRAPITAAEMTGTDAKAQRLGVSGGRLMEHAGTAVAATARALMVAAAAASQATRPEAAEHRGTGPVLVLCGPGNNGGDGFVAARRLAAHGIRVVVVLVSASSRPGTPDAARNWDRLGPVTLVERIHAPAARDIATLGQGIERAALVIDALLGTGVRGELREPVRTAVELCNRARAAGVPVLRRGHAHRVRPHLRRALRPGRPGRRHGDLPPAQDGPPDAAWAQRRGPRPGRADRDPRRGGSCLKARGVRAGARSWSSRRRSSGWSSRSSLRAPCCRRFTTRSSSFPTTIVVLVAGTVGVLALAILGRQR